MAHGCIKHGIASARRNPDLAHPIHLTPESWLLIKGPSLLRHSGCCPLSSSPTVASSLLAILLSLSTGRLSKSPSFAFTNTRIQLKMRGLYMGLGAMALASVNAWEYPFCVRLPPIT